MQGFSGLVLHSWSLDATPLARFLSVARDSGWDAVELRRVDFLRARESGMDDRAVLRTIREAKISVACIGVEPGWMWAEGAERTRLLEGFREACSWAVALDCPRLMSTVDIGRVGPRAQAVASLKEVGDLAAAANLVFAFEFSSQSVQVNSLERATDIVRAAAHPACGLLLDAYHLTRSGASLQEIAEVPASDVTYVQFSDVPRDGLIAGMTLDRLPPGEGRVPFAEVFAAILETGYRGPISYEAPNPAAWSQAPENVAREALAATRRFVTPAAGA